MTAERGTSGLKATTIRFHETLETFFRERHVDFINRCAEPAPKYGSYDPGAYFRKMNFGEFLMNRSYGVRGWYIFECLPPEVNKRTGKLKSNKNIARDRKKLVELASEYGFDVGL